MEREKYTLAPRQLEDYTCEILVIGPEEFFCDWPSDNNLKAPTTLEDRVADEKAEAENGYHVTARGEENEKKRRTRPKQLALQQSFAVISTTSKTKLQPEQSSKSVRKESERSACNDTAIIPSHNR